MTDLRRYLAQNESVVFRPKRPLSVVEEITALQHALWQAGAQPIVYVAEPRLADGRSSPMPIACNLSASRALCAAALGIPDHRQSAKAFARLTTTPIAPVTVGRADAPVQEIVERGNDADLGALPALRQHAGDAGHYITAGHVTTYDPESGIDNMGVQRCWVRGPRLIGCYVYETSHNHLNMRKFWAKGEACPVAIWIGHHPAVGIGAQAKIGYPESHWAAAGGALGAPLRLVPSITHGERIMVPADAEIVIEGWVPPGRLEAEGPFAEYTGYMGPQIANPVIEVSCITRRKDAIYLDCGSGLPDHLIPDNMAMEGAIYAMTRRAAPSLVNVHVPFSGRRYHAYLQFNNPKPGEVRDALLAAISYRRLKAVIGVDDDIDIFDDRHVMWAIATRLQWHRDLISVDGLTHANLDPTLPAGATTQTKVALDATLPPPRAPGLPPPIAPVNKVSPTALTAARAALDGIDSRHWPKA